MKSHNGQKLSRQIDHYQIISWQDEMPIASTDADQMSALNFLVTMQLNQMEKKDSCGPTVVHCSAGIGRTGTFIAICQLMDQIKKMKSNESVGYELQLQGK